MYPNLANPIHKKLRLLPGQQVLLLHAPPGMEALLTPVPEGASIVTASSGTVDVILLFATSPEVLRASTAQVRSLLAEETIFWICYPKGKAAKASGLSRDSSWAVMAEFGLHAVTQVALDAAWSALRFKLGQDPSDAERLAAQQASTEGEFVNLQTRTVTPPPDLAEALAAHPTTQAFFSGLSFTDQREYVRWLVSAKRANTRVQRVAQAVAMLSLGRKNPSDKPKNEI